MSITTTSRNTYVLATLVAAATAASASAISLSLALPVWAMFIGWIAFYTRGLSVRSTLENLACVGTGLLLGLVATLTLQALSGTTGPAWALPLVVATLANVMLCHVNLARCEAGPGTARCRLPGFGPGGGLILAALVNPEKLLRILRHHKKRANKWLEQVLDAIYFGHHCAFPLLSVQK